MGKQKTLVNVYALSSWDLACTLVHTLKTWICYMWRYCFFVCFNSYVVPMFFFEWNKEVLDLAWYTLFSCPLSSQFIAMSCCLIDTWTDNVSAFTVAQECPAACCYSWILFRLHQLFCVCCLSDHLLIIHHCLIPWLVFCEL